MKIFKVLILMLVSLIFIGVIFLFEIEDWPAGSSIAGIVLGFSLPALYKFIQDLFDTTYWKSSQRKLKRGGFINDNTIIRISFAYLYRIKVGDKYLLVKNERGTGKYQPVGGVYKLLDDEKIELKNRFYVKDDNKISIDKSSRNDYRLRIENKYLRKFVRRFNNKSKREQISNLGREFREELIKKGIVDWKQISYRVCGRHMSEISFSKHFQCYELLLADVVELLPTAEQESDLKHLLSKQSDTYLFANAEDVVSMGIDTENGVLKETIADHTSKIIEENEGKLMKIHNSGKIYIVNL